MILSTNILALIEEAKAPYWTLYSKAQRNTGGNPRIAEYAIGDDSSVEDSIDTLKKMLDMLSDGKYVIKYYKDEKQMRAGYYEVDFIVTGKPVNAYGVNPNQINGIGNAPGTYPGSVANIGEVVNEKVQAILDKRELEDLKKKVAELEQQKEDPSGWKTQAAKIMGTLNDTAPHMVPVLVQEAMSIIKGIAGIFRPATLSGSTEVFESIPNKTSEQNNQNFTEMNENQLSEIEAELQERNEEYAAVLIRLRAVDTDLLATLNKMAAKAESNPKIIDTLKMFL